MKKRILIALFTVLFISSANAKTDCTRVSEIIAAIDKKENSLKLDEFKTLAQQCPSANVFIMLANAYLNNEQDQGALKALKKAKAHIKPQNNKALGIVSALESQAYVKSKKFCKAHGALIQATDKLGATHPVVKEVALDLEFLRSQQKLEERTLACMLSATRSAMSRGVGIRPSINMTIAFATNSDVPTVEGKQQVTELVKVLSSPEYDDYRFIVVGHADIRGDDDHNMALSQRRADQVLQQISKNIPNLSERISAEGKGESKPIAEGNSTRVHAVNRRVEILLKSL